MNEIKVSIIIPVYNVSDYLKRCLDSCVYQTMQEIEIILIDDCSPDPLDRLIMREYEERFPNKVVCIWQEKNRGQGEARNTGIRAARGEYIYCLDSDDYIELNLCEKMYCAIQATDADMAICDTERVVTDKSLPKWESNGDFASENMADRMMSLKVHAIWLIMLRKSLIVENDLFFPPTIGFEDIQCTFWILAAKKIARVHEILHHYIMRESSVTQTHRIESYRLSVETVKIVFASKYYKSLSDEVKGLLFLYIMRFVPGWLLSVNKYYPESARSFCEDVLNFEVLSGVCLETINHNSEHKQYLVRIITFMKNIMNLDDFRLELIEYLQYQQRLYSHRVCRNELFRYHGKRVTIWGAGRRGLRNANMLTNLGVSFRVTDGNERMYGTKITPIHNVDSWESIREVTDVVFVSVVGRFEEVRGKILNDSPHIEVVDFDDLLKWSL